jgi:hypothetical protein
MFSKNNFLRVINSMPFSITQVFVFRNQESTGSIGARLWGGRLRIRRLILGERKMFICSATYPNKIPGPPSLLYDGNRARLLGKKSGRGMKLRTHSIYFSG